MNRQSISGNLYCAIWNFHDPEEAIGQSPGAEVMQLGPETGIPEIQSYFDKCAARSRRFCCASAVGIGGFSSDVFALVYADVRDHAIGIALIIRCGAKCIPHSGDATKVSYAMGIRIHGIERRSLVGRSRKELAEKPVRRNDIAARDGNRLNREIRYGIDLCLQRN